MSEPPRLLQIRTEPLPINGPVERPPNVRLADPSDEAAILDLLLQDLEENATTVASTSIVRLTTMIEGGTRGRGSFVLVIDGADGHPVAVAILQPDAWWWSEEIFLREIVLYVSPEARHGQAGSDLLLYECWLSDQMSREYGHRVHVLAGVTATKRLLAKERLYARRMNRIGSFYCYPAIIDKQSEV